MHARGVQEYHLGIVAVPHAGDFISCGLGVGGDDGNLFTQQGVHEGRFPYVRPAYQGGEAGMEFFISFCHRFSL